MMEHRFQVGDAVSFVNRSAVLNQARGEYDVVKLMPIADNSDDPQYRVRSHQETHERVARESELRRVMRPGG